MVLSIPITTDDRNLLGRGDIVPWSDDGSLCESEELDEEFRGDVYGESSAHFESAPEFWVDQRQMITRRKEHSPRFTILGESQRGK